MFFDITVLYKLYYKPITSVQYYTHCMPRLLVEQQFHNTMCLDSQYFSIFNFKKFFFVKRLVLWYIKILNKVEY